MALLDKIPTPNPNEFSLLVLVPMEQVVAVHMPTAEVTTYRDFKMHPTVNRAEGYADYIYLKATGPDNEGRLGFSFGKNKTDTQKYTPYDSELHTDPSFYWPNVMERWKAVPDPTKAIEGRDPNGNATYDMKWNALYRLRPYVDGPSQMERLWYLAPTKFDLQQVVTMQTVSFGWDLPGDGMEPARMLIGSRIHRPTRVLGPAVLSSTTFEPTTPPGWTRHLHFTDQKQTESGLWLMWEDYAIPPGDVNVIRDK